MLNSLLPTQGVTECDGQELSSLPTSSFPPGISLPEATTTLLSTLTRLRAHFFFMRLDYQLAHGLPCLPTSSVAALTRKYKRWVLFENKAKCSNLSHPCPIIAFLCYQSLIQSISHLKMTLFVHWCRALGAVHILRSTNLGSWETTTRHDICQK